MSEPDSISLEEYHRLLKKRPRHGNVKVQEDGYTFDSKAEYYVYLDLRTRLKAGEISRLAVHPKYILQSAFTAQNGEKIRAISYRPDFRYLENNRVIVIEVKGFETQAWRIRYKLFRKQYPHIKFILHKVKKGK